MDNKNIHYDFILFENQYAYEFHYKDLGNLARLLQKAGYSVAIADVFKEDKLCHIENIPHITFEKKAPAYFTDLNNQIESKSIVKRVYIRILHSLYLRYVLKTITPLCDNIYMGALVYNTPFSIWSCFRKDKQYYFWGLRSYIAVKWKRTGMSKPIGVVSRLFYQLLQKHRNVKLICSTDAIRKEFEIEADIDSQRLIVRPERVTASIVQPTLRSDGKLRILSIGSTRKSKNIHFILDALKLANNPNIIYTIAGANLYDDDYENIIEEKMCDMPNVVRINRVLTDKEFEDHLNACDFLITCESNISFSISSGTLSDALLHAKPVIGPNYNVYYDEIHGNGVGIIFDYDNIQSLADALNEAYTKGVAPFVNNLVSYQEKFLEDKIVAHLKTQIEEPASMS